MIENLAPIITRDRLDSSGARKLEFNLDQFFT